MVTKLRRIGDNRGNDRIRFISLACGSGPMGMGLKQAGWEEMLAVDIDPIHIATHEYNYPFTFTLCADISDLTGSDILRAAGLQSADEFDCLVVSLPCQSFSVEGKRRLTEDDRGALIEQFLRLLIDLNPPLFIFENVPGINQGKSAEFFEDFMNDLRFKPKRNYCLSGPQILNAADFGVAQNRKRLFILGTRVDLGANVLGGMLHLPSAADLPVRTVEDAIGDLVYLKAGSSLYDGRCYDSISTYAKQLRDPWKYDKDNFHPYRVIDPEVIYNNTVTEHSTSVRKRFLATPQGGKEPISRKRRLCWTQPAYTLKAGTPSSKGSFTAPRPIHPMWGRCITVREMMRLQGLPDWFRVHNTVHHGARQVGNSVCPAVMRYIAKVINHYVEYQPKRMGQPGPEFRELTDNDRDDRLLSMGPDEAAAYYGIKNPIAKRLK